MPIKKPKSPSSIMMMPMLPIDLESFVELAIAKRYQNFAVIQKDDQVRTSQGDDMMRL